MICQILFSGKNKKNITNLLSDELAKRVVKVNMWLLQYLRHIMIFYLCKTPSIF